MSASEEVGGIVPVEYMRRTYPREAIYLDNLIGRSPSEVSTLLVAARALGVQARAEDASWGLDSYRVRTSQYMEAHFPESSQESIAQEIEAAGDAARRAYNAGGAVVSIYMRAPTQEQLVELETGFHQAVTEQLPLHVPQDTPGLGLL